jgi:hypothetical protein
MYVRGEQKWFKQDIEKFEHRHLLLDKVQLGSTLAHKKFSQHFVHLETGAAD